MAREQVVGIYSISTPDGVYIGSSIDIYARWTKHRSDLRLNTHRCKPLQRSVNSMLEEGRKVQLQSDAEGPKSDKYRPKTKLDVRYEPVFKIVERCLKAELEQKEAEHITNTENTFNLSQKTGVGMRDPEVARRNVASRGDAQHGMGSSSVKLDEEGYIEMFAMLLKREKFPKIVQKLNNEISVSSIRRVARGESHRWLRELNETEYDQMVKFYTDVTPKQEKIAKVKGVTIVHKGGDSFTGNSLEISEKLGVSVAIVQKLLKGQLIFVKGWKAS